MNSAPLSALDPTPQHQHSLPSQQLQLPAPPRSILEPLNFMPEEGDEKTPISITARFIAQSSERVFLRIVVGDLAIQTEIVDIGTDNHVYRLDGFMPAFCQTRCSSKIVPLAIQALDASHNVILHERVGDFQYWTTGSIQSRARTASLSMGAPSSPFSPIHAGQVSRRGSVSTVPSSPTARRHRRVLRRRDAADGPEEQAERVILDYLTPLEEMGRNLHEDEKQLGRRLVQFDCQLEGNTLKISCQPIRQEDYRDDERTMTISCIYRSSTTSTYFTSVDVIQLLQHLADERFKVEEKNRIRRNLEGFHPTTISKSRVNLESFFMQIMEFPAPKPRNIEKDVKVFTWDNLGPAIDKIMSKYSIVDEHDGSDSPGFMQSTLPADIPLGLPYHHPAQDNHHSSMYPGLMSNYHASPAFETTSSQSSDGDRAELSYSSVYSAPPPYVPFSTSQHHAQGPYHHAPHHAAHSLYHTPIDGAYSAFGGLDHPRQHPSVAAGPYM